MAWVLGNLLHTTHQYLDAAGAPKTGMAKDVDIGFTMYRDPGTGAVAATETITYTETGASGYYTISFTPDNTGLYTLWAKETNADSGLRNQRFDWAVLSAGSIFLPAFSNAFCSESDIERWLQQPITASTGPTSTQAAAFAETRAAVLASLCAGLGSSVTPSTVVAGSRLEDLLREANAIGAALDYTVAASFKEGTRRTERIPELLGLWHQYAGNPQASGKPTVGYIEMELKQNGPQLSTDYITSGDTLAAADANVVPLNESIQIRMGDKF